MSKMNWGKRPYAVLALFAATAMALPAQTFTTLHSFDGGDGENPQIAVLVQGIDGNLYGTMPSGGAYSGGTVFKITPSGTFTTIYNFCSQSGCSDGKYPLTGLVQTTNGDFYGETFYGGSKSGANCVEDGCGTVFKITPRGTLTTLYNFCSQSGCTDGENPMGTLVNATNGYFYGTTYAGGADGQGTVFKISPSGTLTTLHNFCSQSGCTDGSGPIAGLVQATNGNLYGMTNSGGAKGDGTVFKIAPSGGSTFKTLYSFCSQSGCTDGESTRGGLVQAANGDLYGTTLLGGANGGGTVFKISPSGKLTTLYSFCSQSGCADGDDPWAGLVQATNGDFYGTTSLGGTYGTYYGTVFSQSVGLGSFVETRPTSGVAGRLVEILGTDLTGATTVTFNGTPAAFTVVSPTLITTTVPTGATTGTVQVVTPSGALMSNVPFRVLP
jgi:uncharacterized repeat protein (TIGR03803 family)